MKKTASVILLLIIILSQAMFPGEKKAWELATSTRVTEKHFIENGKYFLLHANKDIFLVETAGGNTVWSAVIEDYEKKGLKILWDDKQYIVAKDESLISYDALTGNVNWEQSYKGFWQKDYKEHEQTSAGVLINYGKRILRVDMSNGNELWRADVKLNKDRDEKGEQNIYAVSTTAGERFLIATEEGVLLLDANTGNEIWKNKEDLTDEEHLDAVTIIGSKALLFFDNDMIVFINLTDGKEIFSKKQDLDDVEGFSLIENVNNKDYLLLSLEDSQIMFDLKEEKLIWEKTDDVLEGILIDSEPVDGGKQLLCHFFKRGVRIGSTLSLVKLETETGNIIFNEPIAWTSFAVSSFAMSLRNWGKDEKPRYEMGFEYDIYNDGDDAVYLIKGTSGASGMANPLTKDEPGEGLVKINKSTGEVKYRSYFEVNSEGISFSKLSGYGLKDQPETKIIENNIYIAGTDRIISGDLNTGKVNWLVEDITLPSNWWINENTLFLQSGKTYHQTTVNAKGADVDVKKIWNESPFMLYAFDISNGSIIWKNKFDEDLNYGMNPVYVESTKMLYCSDSENLFAVKLDRSSGGKKSWSFNYDDDGDVGELELEDRYAVHQKKTTTFDLFGAITGGLKKGIKSGYSADIELVLRSEFRRDNFVVFGPDGICAVDLNGKKLWLTKWDWKRTQVQLNPKFLQNGKIVYMLRDNIQCIDEKTGQLLWSEKDDSDAEAMLSPDEKFIITIDKKYVNAYNVN